MKKYKKISLLLIVLMIGSLFTGCNQEEKELTNAFIKSQEILSLESTSDVEFNLKAEGLDADTQVIFDEIANQVNNMELSMSQKSVANEGQTVAKAQIDANVKLNDMNFDTSMWVDVDMSGDKPVIKEIIKLPSVLMSTIPGAAEKEYIIMDFETMNESIAGMEQDMPQPMDLDETMAIAMKYQKRFTEEISNFIEDYDFELPIVTKLEDKVVDGENIKYYQVELDNDSFKEFLKYTTISILQDEHIMPVYEEYLKELMDASGEEMPEELSLTENKEEMVEATIEFFKTIEDLIILGEDGIFITLGINEDGYFVSEEGKMDFIIDTNQFMSLIAPAVENAEALEETPVFELTVAYNSKIKNINEDIKITMPATTEENSIDYMDLLEDMVAEVEQEQELVVIIEDELVEFTNDPILVKDHYLVSTRDMAKEFGADISWDADTKEVIIEKDGKVLNFSVTSSQLLVDGALQDVKTDVVIRDSVSYIPLRAIAENLGYTFEWNQEFQMMIVSK